MGFAPGGNLTPTKIGRFAYFILPTTLGPEYNRPMKSIVRLLPALAACVCALPFTATAQNFQQSFDDYPSLVTAANPWSFQNRSDSVAGGQPWFQGSPEVFAAQAGAGYVAANYFSTGGATGAEHISNWFLSPTLNLTNGGLISFFTRSGGGAPDRLELRLSLNGTSTNVGATSSDVGDFTILLLEVNPTQTASLYPTAWTQFNATILGAPVGGTVGRIAFRYNVTNSGVNGVNGDYIGVDTLTSNLTVVPEPGATVLCLLGLLGAGWLVIRQRRAAVPTKR